MSIIGRKRMNEVITADSGSSARGNAELRISRPPLVTERTPTVSALWMSWNTNSPPTRCAKKSALRESDARRMSTRMK